MLTSHHTLNVCFKIIHDLLIELHAIYGHCAMYVIRKRRTAAIQGPLPERAITGTGKMRVAKLRVGILLVEVRAKHTST